MNFSFSCSAEIHSTVRFGGRIEERGVPKPTSEACLLSSALSSVGRRRGSDFSRGHVSLNQEISKRNHDSAFIRQTRATRYPAK